MSEELYLRVREMTPKTLDLHVMQILPVRSERQRKIDLFFTGEQGEVVDSQNVCSFGDFVRWGSGVIGTSLQPSPEAGAR